ncbi:MAG: tRNA (N6-isopentenyl adenosine(37)-C2)-methylthiotransferase MiaB [Candidatus Sericytochromatia bacterium]|uniref:tRNA-2-methylthio-N(6)-dimethylallyladenosine synthase n=1 Tax=Candidatus Tanganyikabacteria bacterium TaxID=2961651 RepID=A0A937X4G4_9BACT|nr:tRNA (N6-isopentenyl adenosine(37)-C2)-methylthiotransferase MiaB [Candidatus Tanganyikabacteria bacterium]
MPKVFLKSFGCQMNLSDGERVVGLLADKDFQLTDDEDRADLLLVNTCAIREKAEDKLFSLLGEWRRLKRDRPDMIIAVMGCVAQAMKDEIRKRNPAVDVVVGTHNFHELPALVEEVREHRRPITRIGRLRDEIPDDLPTVREGKFHAWVPVIYGCSYFCTFCIVPYTRGPFQSRQPEAIEREVRALVAEGFKEITLLGQTVDRYGKDLTDNSTTLSALLRRLSPIEGLARIRFLTSHPIDLDEDLVSTVAELPNVMEYFHFPIQAGSDRVLADMKRQHTVAEYLAKVDLIRRYLPDAAISGDLIVGFPGETDEDFEETLRIVREVEFDTNNTATYSVRPWTPAGKREDQVAPEIMRERLQRLNEVVAETALRRNRRLVGTMQEILVEGPSSKNPEVYFGRTRGNKECFFPAEPGMEGRIVGVEISEARPFTLRGAIVTHSKALVAAH